VVLDLGPAGGRASLCCPEWHPARPVSLPARLLPLGTAPGDWLSCTADLSAASAGQLNLAFLALGDDPGAATCHRPAVSRTSVCATAIDPNTAFTSGTSARPAWHSNLSTHQCVEGVDA
jgi:hypothetical protein